MRMGICCNSSCAKSSLTVQKHQHLTSVRTLVLQKYIESIHAPQKTACHSKMRICVVYTLPSPSPTVFSRHILKARACRFACAFQRELIHETSLHARLFISPYTPRHPAFPFQRRREARPATPIIPSDSLFTCIILAAWS